MQGGRVCAFTRPLRTRRYHQLLAQLTEERQIVHKLASVRQDTSEEKRTMKNITIVAILAAMMAFGAVVACGGAAPTPPTAPDPGAAAAGAANSAAASAAPATSK